MYLTKRILIHLAGYLVMGLGVIFMYRALQGSFPYDAISHYITVLVNQSWMTLGFASMIFGTAYTLLNFAIMRKWQVFIGLIPVYTFGFVLNFWELIIPKGYSWGHPFLNGTMAIVGLFIYGLGIAMLLVNKKFPIAPSELMMMYLKVKLNNKTFLAKLIIEISLITIAMTLAWITQDFSQIGWFTFASVILIGPIIQFFEKFTVKLFGIYE